MPKETMTPQERWQAVFSRQIPDRVPMDYWGTPEITRKLMNHLSCETYHELMQKLHVDYPISAYPSYIGPQVPQGEDVFGIRYSNFNYGTGVYDEAIYAPLAGYQSVDEIEAENLKQQRKKRWITVSAIIILIMLLIATSMTLWIAVKKLVKVLA